MRKKINRIINKKINKKTNKIPNKITDKKRITQLIMICWIAYCSTYLGRLNFAASMNDIMYQEGYTKTQMGLVVTAFFIAYGAGQFFNGFLGDIVRSRNMVFSGLLLSGISNFLMGGCNSPVSMAVFWLLNGIAQSMIWSPMLNLLSGRLETEQSMKASVSLSLTVPAGTFMTYLMCSLFIRYWNWRGVFYVSACVIVIIAFLWLIAMAKLEEHVEIQGVGSMEGKESQESISPTKDKNKKSQLMFMIIIALIFGAVFHGVIKDGITTWTPTYLMDAYHTSTSLAIQLSMLLPITNLAGVYAANYLNKNICKNELLTSALFFAIAVIGILPMLIWHIPMFAVLILLCITSSAMLGVNTMLISLVPIYFKKYGRVSSVCGIINSAAYIGSALSGYGTGALTQSFGWRITFAVWSILAVLGFTVCYYSRNSWKKFQL